MGYCQWAETIQPLGTEEYHVWNRDWKTGTTTNRKEI